MVGLLRLNYNITRSDNLVESLHDTSILAGKFNIICSIVQ
jgi:hypothetical protein